MLKWKTVIIVMLCMVGVVAADEMCEDNVRVNTTCRMITPSLSCTQYNYTLVNYTGSLINSGDLTNVYDDIYYFNFSQPVGDYVIVLCDDTTREVSVIEGEDNNMIMFALILAPLIFGIILIIGGSSLGEDHAPLKWFIFFLTFVTFFSSLHFSMLAVVKFYDFPELQNAIGTTTYWAGMVFFIVLVYFLIYFIKVLVEIAAQKRKEKLNYG